jgi:hypothetical protein
MHARELIELAALVSAHGPTLVQSGERISAEGIEQYWTTSKVRLDRWGRSLKEFTGQSDVGTKPCQPSQGQIRGVMEEILTGEMLTRVWTAVLCAYDRCRGTDDAEPVARSVMIGHCEARHRVLTLLVRGKGIDAEDSIRLNRLRRRAERWSDLLVGNLAGIHGVNEFAISPERAKDFSEDLRDQSDRLVWSLTLASLRAAFHRGLECASPNEDLNARIAASILSCFPAELFDSTGLFHSLWLMRLMSFAADTQGMIDELMGSDRPKSSGGGNFMPRGERGRFGR